MKSEGLRHTAAGPQISDVRNPGVERHFQSQGHIEYIKLTLGASFENVSKTVIRAGGNPIP